MVFDIIEATFVVTLEVLEWIFAIFHREKSEPKQEETP